jgi:nicotinamide-nucleotide amidase
LDKLLKIIPEHIYGFDEITLEESLGILLLERGLTLSTAESCTGGNIARLITSIPGSSRYFSGSVIAYSNRIKSGILRVDPVILEKEGAVSRPVVEQMARGVQALQGTDTAIATSGIAGPDGGTEAKPVGTTWISVVSGDQVYSKKYRFGGSRDRIIDQASYTALQLLRRLILGTL